MEWHLNYGGRKMYVETLKANIDVDSITIFIARKMTNEIKRWCKENLSSHYSVHLIHGCGILINVSDPEDLVAVKLMWT